MIKIKIDYIFSFLLLLSIGIILYSSIMFRVDNVRIDNEQLNNYNDGWVYLNDNGDRSDIILPQKIHTETQDITTITNDIPEKWEGLTLTFRTSDQLIKVYFDGVETYTYGFHDVRIFGKTPGSAIHFIDIPNGMINGEIKIELSSPYNNYGGILPSMCVGSKSACVFQLFKENMFELILCFIILMFGVLLTIFYFLVKKLKTSAKGLLYLGEFSILMALASIIETRFLQFFFGNQSVFSVCIFLLHMLAPIPLIMYLGEVYFVTLRHKFHCIAKVFMLNFLVMVSFQLMNILDFMEMNWLNHVLLLFSSIFVIVTIIKLIIITKWNFTMTYFCAVFFVFLFCIFMDVIGFYGHKADVTLYQRLGLFIFIFALSILDIRKVISLIKQGMETDTLRRIAYEDILTKCKNRIYFEEKFSEIEKNIHQKSNVGVAIFDINNLKVINDHKGHCEGDSMLINASKLINDFFSEYTQISRIGGDEFAFVISDIPPEQLEENFIQFKEAMRNQKNNSEINYDIAYGYAYYNPDLDSNLQATFIRADRKMYKCKKQMKKAYELIT